MSVAWQDHRRAWHTLLNDATLTRLGWERLALATFALLYLWLFRTAIPSGDGLVYAWHIEAGEIALNPNHLLMDPVGYAFCQLLWSLGVDLSTLDALKLLSAVSTAATLVLFHCALCEAGIQQRWLRVAAVLGVLASRNFMTMAISEEFFMIQMPLLAAALWMLVRIETRPTDYRSAAILGALLGVAAAVTINNVVLGVFLVAYLLLSRRCSALGWRLAGTTALLATLAALPIFLIGYAQAAAEGSFLQWMLAYQGSSEGSPASLYGVSLTPAGIATSMARLGLNTFTNLVSIGYLGTLLKSWVFGAPLEITPQPAMFVLGALSLLVVMVVMAMLAWWLLRRLRGVGLVSALVVWIAAFYVFNFFWDDSSDQFWFQILPALWLLLAMLAAALIREGQAGPAGRLQLATLLLALTPALLLINTLQEVAPRAFLDMQALKAEHRALLREGDLEIIPGWDDVRWVEPDDSYPRHRQINLMTAAMSPAGSPGHIEHLFAAVEQQLAAGGRVIVARVFDKDHDPRPWDQLRKLGWPRERLQAQFARYDSRPVAVMNGSVFRELTLPETDRPR